MPSCSQIAWSPITSSGTVIWSIGLGVHEVVALAVLVEEVVVAVLDEGALDLLGRAVALGDLHAVGDAAHVELGHRRALAGVDVLGAQDDVELAVLFDDVALAERAGDDLHGDVSLWSDAVDGRGSRSCIKRIAAGAGSNGLAGAIMRDRRQSPGAALRLRPAFQHGMHEMTSPPQRLALVAAARPRRPPALPARAQPHRRRPCAHWFEADGFVEVEGAILQVSPGNEAHLHAFATSDRCPTAARRAALPAHLARIRLQEAAGGGRGADLRLRPRLPQPRARAAAPSRIHDAGMVSRRRALRGADGRLRRDAAPSRPRPRDARALRWRGARRPIPSPSPSG